MFTWFSDPDCKETWYKAISQLNVPISQKKKKFAQKAKKNSTVEVDLVKLKDELHNNNILEEYEPTPDYEEEMNEIILNRE